MTALKEKISKQVGRCVIQNVGMTQLGFRGLAEEWWLRHLGDVHWQLIADSVGQNTTVFKDREGRQVYAAFCATEFDQPNPDHVDLGDTLTVKSTLWSAGRSRLQSIHALMLGDVIVARFRLISTFVCHAENGVNASISRTMPYLVPVLDPAPDEFAIQTSTAARANRSQKGMSDEKVLIRPCVGTDFNAVGLLYFPSFTRFFDQTERGLRPLQEWSPVRRRRVLYFRNIERGEEIFGTPAVGESDGAELWSVRAGQKKVKKISHCALQRF
ncbi:MAG: Pnap_2097 family protein [Pseudoruegeria sp.]